MKTKTTLLIGLVITVSGCVSNVDTMQNYNIYTPALDKEALLELLPGSAVYQNNKDLVKVAFYSDDNTMKGNVWGSGVEQVDQGGWMVNDKGQFCNQWQGTWSQGDNFNCYSIIPGESKDQYMMILDSEDEVDFRDFGAQLVTITSDDADEFE